MKPFQHLLRFLLFLIALSSAAQAFYDSAQGRWLSRDPIEENGGNNLYAFVGNNGVSKIDVFGLVTLNEARDSLKDTGVAPAIPGQMARGPRSQNSHRPRRPASYSDTQIFDEWIRLEGADTNWSTNLPKCPDKICIKNDKPVDCDNGQWEDIGGPGLHEGAEWCMRSKEVGESAQQCCYNKEGKLMKDPPAAGTPDRVAANAGNSLLIGHFAHDVQPYYLANELGRASDYNTVRPPDSGGGGCYK